jgi:hypothetical protein
MHASTADKEGRTAFSEEKEAKRLLLRGIGVSQASAHALSNKVFLLLFVHKKKTLK